MTQFPNQIALARPEFLALLHVVRGSTVAGIPPEELSLNEVDPDGALRRTGNESLRQRDLLRVDQAGAPVYHRYLLTMMATLAHPDLAVIAARDNPGVGRQLFLFYRAGERAMEQTFPEEQLHRLAILPDPDAIVSRLQELFPITDGAPDAIAFEVDQHVFFQAKELADRGAGGPARELLGSHGVEAAYADQFLQALERPVFGGTVSFVRVVDDTAVDARDLGLVRGELGAWSVAQVRPGGPLLRVQRVTIADVAQILETRVEELLASSPKSTAAAA